MSLQRRRGARVQICGRKTVRDGRGNDVIAPDIDNLVEKRASIIWDRSNRAEVPGYQYVQVFRMIVDADVSEAELWGMVLWKGRWYDIVNPPEEHLGRPYHIRSVVALIREVPPGATDYLLPDGGGADGQG